ncbi:MAG: hypothetical protein WDO74_15510 [Pseudomonadota bacterium]
MITSKQRSLIGLAALFAIASTQACGSDATSPTPSGGAPGAAGAHAGAAGAGVSGGGAASAGAPAGGAPAGGGGAGGAAAGAPAGGGGAGGASAGSGGSSAGAAGKGSGGSGGGSAGAGGASTATYAAVKAIFSASCGTGMCHNGNPHTNFQQGELHTTLSTAIAATPAGNECNGTTLITSGDAAGSFLVKVISNAMSTCKDAGADKMIPKMPYMCGTGANPACLTTAQVKTISDWITAGAPH